MIKKIGKSRLFLGFASYLIRFYVFLLTQTCKIELNFSKETFELLNQEKQFLACCWHGRLLLVLPLIKHLGKFIAVVSSHGDGLILKNILEKMGHRIASGSTRKGAVKAMQMLLKNIKDGYSVALTPDGPKGPRFKVNSSIMALSEKHNLPVITMCYSATRAKVLSSWDKFIVPIPFFSKILIEISAPVKVAQTKHSPNIQLEKFLNKQMKALDKKCDLKIEY